MLSFSVASTFSKRRIPKKDPKVLSIREKTDDFYYIKLAIKATNWEDKFAR
jgi:hypothetical protein